MATRSKRSVKSPPIRRRPARPAKAPSAGQEAGRAPSAKAGKPRARAGGRGDRARDRRVAHQGQDDRQVPRPRLRREGHRRPPARSARPASSAWTSRRTSSPSTSPSRARPRRSPSSRRPRRPRPPSTSPPTPTAKARRSPGTSPTSSPSKRADAPGAVPRDHQGRGPRGDGESRRDRRPEGRTRSRRAGSSTGWSATRRARSSGGASRPASPPGGCRPSRSGSSSSASARSARSSRRSTGRIEALLRQGRPDLRGRARQDRRPQAAAPLGRGRAGGGGRGAAACRSWSPRSRSGSAGRIPAAPFTTSTLQQEAAKKLGFSSRRTMRAAQDLYEGIEVGEEGAVGLITYMRTDSVRVSDTAIASVRDFIGTNYGKPLPARRAQRRTAPGRTPGCRTPTRPSGPPTCAAGPSRCRRTSSPTSSGSTSSSGSASWPRR